MPSATITSKGQVTIPKKVRDQLHLKSGDVINFEVESSQKASIKVNRRSAKEVYGMLHRKGQRAYTVEEMDAGIVEYLKEKYNVK